MTRERGTDDHDDRLRHRGKQATGAYPPDLEPTDSTEEWTTSDAAVPSLDLHPQRWAHRSRHDRGMGPAPAYRWSENRAVAHFHPGLRQRRGEDHPRRLERRKGRLASVFHNLTSNPEVQVQVGRHRFTGTAAAIESSDADYPRLWELMNGTNNRRYDAYQAKTSRPIPLVAIVPGLEPTDRAL